MLLLGACVHFMSHYNADARTLHMHPGHRQSVYVYLHLHLQAHALAYIQVTPASLLLFVSLCLSLSPILYPPPSLP